MTENKKDTTKKINEIEKEIDRFLEKELVQTSEKQTKEENNLKKDKDIYIDTVNFFHEKKERKFINLNKEEKLSEKETPKFQTEEKIKIDIQKIEKEPTIFEKIKEEIPSLEEKTIEKELPIDHIRLKKEELTKKERESFPQELTAKSSEWVSLEKSKEDMPIKESIQEKKKEIKHDIKDKNKEEFDEIIIEIDKILKRKPTELIRKDTTEDQDSEKKVLPEPEKSTIQKEKKEKIFPSSPEKKLDVEFPKIKDEKTDLQDIELKTIDEKKEELPLFESVEEFPKTTKEKIDITAPLIDEEELDKEIRIQDRIKRIITNKFPQLLKEKKWVKKLEKQDKKIKIEKEEKRKTIFKFPSIRKDKYEFKKPIVQDQQKLIKEDLIEPEKETGEIITPPDEERKSKISFELPKIKKEQEKETEKEIIEPIQEIKESITKPEDKIKRKISPKLPIIKKEQEKETEKEIIEPKKETELDADKRKIAKKTLFKKPLAKEQLKDNLELFQKRIIFRVENLPSRDEFEEDEIDFINEKIKENESKGTLYNELDEGEVKAIELAEQHIKKRITGLHTLNKIKNGKKGQNINFPQGFSPSSRSIQSDNFYFEDEGPIHELKPELISNKKTKPSLSLENEGIDDLELIEDVIKSDSIKLSDLGLSEKEWEELNFYTIHEPFAFTEILREKDSLDKCYFLIEAGLTEEEENLFAFIMDTLANLEIETSELEQKGEDRYLIEKVDQIINDYDIKIDEDARKKIYYYINKSSLGFGKIDPLMKDPNIEDISCDGAGVPIFLYHRKFGSLKSNIKFNDEEELSSFVYKLAQKCGKHISIAEPILDATMPDGSRIQMTLSDEVTARGSTFTIRKFRADPFSPPDLVEFNTMSSEMVAYMWLAVENGINTLFAGGTASGKTTALNAISLFIPRESKIVSIEETREINLPHPNWIPGVSRSGFGEVVADKVIGEIDLYDLMKAALRQRPEYIIVGEIRGKEAYVLFQAMATGHATYSTVHADSAQSLIHRLEGKPVNIPRVMLQSLDIVCLHVITRVKNMRARRCKQIIEIIDIDPTTKEILTNEVFRWEPVEDKFIYSGKSYVLERIRAEKDMSREEMTKEIKNRIKVVEWMSNNDIREFRDVAKLVTQYTESPDETLKKIIKGDEK